MRFELVVVLAGTVFGCAQVQDADATEGQGLAGAAGAAGVAGAVGVAGAAGGDTAGSGATPVEDASGVASGQAGMNAVPQVDAVAGPAADPCAEPPMPGMAQPGCPCAPGSQPSACDPPDIRVVQKGLSGKLVCSEGIAYCRHGEWSTCEVLIQYASFVPD